MKQQNRMMVEAACTIAKKTRSMGVLLYADMFEDYESLAKIGEEKQTALILAVKDPASFQEASSVFKKVLRIPNVPLGRINQIKMAITEEGEEGATDSKVFFSGEVWSSADYYTRGDAKFAIEAFASIEGDISSDWIWYASIQATAGSFERDGVDIFSRDGEVPMVSLREAYASSDSWRIGKQVLADETSVKFDFASFNIFESRDLSRPFSALDE